MMKTFALLAMVLIGTQAFAQADGGGGSQPIGSDAPYELGFHLGSLLPDQIDGVTEIMGLGGARMGYRFAPQSYLEGGLITGNGEGVKWKNIHADVRMDIPVEGLVGLAYVGADSTYYQGMGRSSSKLIFGGHAGGGIQVHVSGSMWFRGDMKFNFSPGTSLYISAGFVFRLGSGGGAG
jgi:hypothetical protein